MRQRAVWSIVCVALVASGFALTAQDRSPAPDATTAIVGGTVLDGNGGAPLADAVVLIAGSRITAVGPRSAVPIPAGARQIDARGRWILPGLIDTNVHLSLYGGQNDRYETLVRYQPRQEEIVLEAAQIDLRYGITTVRDSYGALVPLTRVRDAIAKGDKVGTRILAAGNILGWSGPYSFSFSRVMGQLTLFQEQMNDFIAQGGGEELMAMRLPELRQAINAYIDKGPDFLKYGGTSHFSEPTFIGFSADAQKVIVEEGHRAEPLRRDPFDERRRPAHLDRRRHRRHPAPGAPRRSRYAGRHGSDDSRPQPDRIDAGEHHYGAGVEEASEDERGGGKEARRRGEGHADAQTRKDDRRAAQGGDRGRAPSSSRAGATRRS